MDLSTIGTLKVAELKAELEKRNISKSGTKSVLVERLRQALTAEQEATENPENPDEEVTGPLMLVRWCGLAIYPGRQELWI